jgi:hypothetical protein
MASTVDKEGSPLVSFAERQPLVVLTLMQFLDVMSILNLDTAMRSRKMMVSFNTIYVNQEFPALSNYRYKGADNNISVGAALLWVMKREVNLRDFVFTVECNTSSIFWAVDRGLYTVASLLLSKGSKTKMPDVNKGEYGLTRPLHQAVYRQRVDLVKLLLEHGADVNARDNSFYTPLQGACSEAHSIQKAFELAQVLVQDGRADVNLTDAAGQTCLIWEAAKGRTKLVKLLLEGGNAFVDAVDEVGRSALYYASEGNSIPVVEALLEAGANVNILNANDRTSLHVAVRRKHLKVAKTLLAYGANPDAIDEEGKAAFSYAPKGDANWEFLAPSGTKTGAFN